MEKQITEIIKEVIATKGVYEVVYANAKGEERTFHVFDARYAEGYGERAIDVRCMENNKDMILAVSRIQRIENYWVDVFDDNDTIPEDGYYLFACRGDNHLEYELYYLRKGDNPFANFEGENSHLNGWFVVDPLAYHRVKEGSEHWIKASGFDPSESYDVVFIVRGANQDDKSDTLKEYISLCDRFAFDDIEFRDSISEVYPLFLYTESNHVIHWDVYRQRKEAKEAGQE